MAFGLNRAEVIGRLGADVTVNHLTNGGRVANLSIATDESYIDKQSGEKIDRTEWHRVVTFQPGLVDMFEKHARKGRLVYVAGKLQTRRWKKDGEDSDQVLHRDPARPRRTRPIPGQEHHRGDDRQPGHAGRCSRQRHRGHRRDSVLSLRYHPPAQLGPAFNPPVPFLLCGLPSTPRFLFLFFLCYRPFVAGSLLPAMASLHAGGCGVSPEGPERSGGAVKRLDASRPPAFPGTPTTPPHS